MKSLKTFTEALRTDIALYWEKCFCSLEQREAFAPYHAGESLGLNASDRRSGSAGVSTCRLSADDFTEELLNLHEAEVKTLEKYYEDHRELFDGVAKWQENWTLYLELDVSARQLHQSVSREPAAADVRFLHAQKKNNDPSRFNNRGGNLLKEEKQRTDLQKSLPKVRMRCRHPPAPPA